MTGFPPGRRGKLSRAKKMGQGVSTMTLSVAIPDISVALSFSGPVVWLLSGAVIVIIFAGVTYLVVQHIRKGNMKDSNKMN